MMDLEIQSVLPPPPRYPSVQASSPNPNGVTVNAPLAEMSNVLTHPSGPEYQLSVGEGNVKVHSLYTWNDLESNRLSQERIFSRTTYI